MTVDPWAEKYNNQSPYLYAGNNPIRFTDFMGLGKEDEVKTGNVIVVYNEEQFNSVTNNPDNENWNVIQASSLANANEQLTAYTEDFGGELNSLVVRSHGGSTGGNLMAVTKDSPTGDDATLENTKMGISAAEVKSVKGGGTVAGPLEVYDSTEELINMGSHVKKGGDVVFTGCGAGAQSKGGGDWKENSLGSQLSSADSYKGKNVYMNQDNSVVGRSLDKPLTKNYQAGFVKFRDGNAYKAGNIQLNSTGNPITVIRK